MYDSCLLAKPCCDTSHRNDVTNQNSAVAIHNDTMNRVYKSQDGQYDSPLLHTVRPETMRRLACQC